MPQRHADRTVPVTPRKELVMNLRIIALGFALAVATLGLIHPSETAAAIFVPPPPVAGSLASGGLAC